MDWNQLGKDFIQRYKETFIRVRLDEADRYQVMLVEDVSENPVSVTLVNRKLGRIILNYETDVEFNFEYPEVGYFNFRGMAVLFRKRHGRQWKRGICDSTCMITNPYAEMGWSGMKWTISPTTAKLFAAFRPRPARTHLKSALDMLSNGNYLSVPLSNSLAIGLTPTEKYKTPMLWYLDQIIGRVSTTKSGGKIILSEAQFKQELTDFLSMTGEKDKYALVT